MDMYITEIKAECPYTGQMKIWGGPNVPGINLQDAQNYCENNGLGYCKVIGKLVAEIPCKEGTYSPDFDKMSDYENKRLN